MTKRDQHEHGMLRTQRSRRTFLLHVALLALGIGLSSTTAAAQSAALDQVAQPEAEQTRPPSSAEVARAALDTDRALLELRQLQLRENELSLARERTSMAGPAIGLGLGLAVALTSIPSGTILLTAGASKRDELAGEGGGDPLRITGGMLLGLGAASALTALVCGIRVRQLRPVRRAADEELRAIRLRRIHVSRSPAPAEVANTALNTSSIDALRQLQRREDQAWQVRSETSLAWPAVGLAVGSVLTPIMVPLGSVLLTVADQNYESTGIGTTTETIDDNPDRGRRAGSVLLALGLTAAATVVLCGTLVRHRRQAKRRAKQELVAVRTERTRLLETLGPPAEPSTP